MRRVFAVLAVALVTCGVVFAQGSTQAPKGSSPSRKQAPVKPLFEVKNVDTFPSFFGQFNDNKYLKRKKIQPDSPQQGRERAVRSIWVVEKQPSPDYYVKEVELRQQVVWLVEVEFTISFDIWLPPDAPKSDVYKALGGKPAFKDYTKPQVAETIAFSVVQKKQKPLPKRPDWKCYAVEITYSWSNDPRASAPHPALAQEGRIEEIQVHSKSLEGNLLGDSATRNVTVYLPGEYGKLPDKRYPVVYLLHGYTANNTLWTCGGYVKDLNIAAIADRVIASGDVQPMIIVAPDCHNTYRGSFYTNSPVTGNWGDFVTKDLVRHIDAKYRTITKRTSRGIAGHSMGGYGAIKIAMKNPVLFASLYAMAPVPVDLSGSIGKPSQKHFLEAAQIKHRDDFAVIHWRSQAVIAQGAAFAPDPKSRPFLCQLPLDANGDRVNSAWEKRLGHDLSTKMLAKYGDNLRKYKAVAIDCGNNDDLLPSISAFLKAMKKAGIKHTFEQFEGDHINRVASQLEKKVLPLFSRTLTFEDKSVAVPIR